MICKLNFSQLFPLKTSNKLPSETLSKYPKKFFHKTSMQTAMQSECEQSFNRKLLSRRIRSPKHWGPILDIKNHIVKFHLI